MYIEKVLDLWLQLMKMGAKTNMLRKQIFQFISQIQISFNTWK